MPSEEKSLKPSSRSGAACHQIKWPSGQRGERNRGGPLFHWEKTSQGKNKPGEDAEGNCRSIPRADYHNLHSQNKVGGPNWLPKSTLPHETPGPGDLDRHLPHGPLVQRRISRSRGPARKPFLKGHGKLVEIRTGKSGGFTKSFRPEGGAS